MEKCKCENLWYSPGPEIKCVNCGRYVLNPMDVSQIVNVVHYPPEICQHPEKIPFFMMSNPDQILCLNCGKFI